MKRLCLLKTPAYPEIVPHLVLLAFLQRNNNVEGTIESDYAASAMTPTGRPVTVIRA